MERNIIIWTSQLIYIAMICVLLLTACNSHERSTEGSIVWQFESWKKWATTEELEISIADSFHPHFYEKQKNVTAQQGQTVYLHCIVKNLGDRTVSWIRRRDFHVLTVGETTYTAEGRFEVVHLPRSNNWILKIKLVEIADGGDYECQVNTHPLMSYFVYLTVLVPVASILGEKDLLVSSGSYINLTCIIRHSPSPPMFVFWYHNDRMINYDSSRGKITLKKKENTALSTLYIKNAKALNSGNYTCGPSNADATSVTVHVVNGEKPAAMQHDSETTSASISFTSFTSFLYFGGTLFIVVLSS
ncbi:zwei Ig domain protein zig-8-like [Limulus polyphemus]|uniref:Zwei Ig domain protein zig-8-like n=1 Tax=Limulus polyphemus TaxID=6850 RepID=A0ABM1T5X1_LIMPO|nr:zwei Ig domain protein zig-8-like [Limulus polyphemus]